MAPLHLSLLVTAALAIHARGLSIINAAGRTNNVANAFHRPVTHLGYANDPGLAMELPFNPLTEARNVFNKGRREKENGSVEWPGVLSKRDLAWIARYRELGEYHARYQNSDVPLNWPENPSLATWVVNQRRKGRQGKGNLSAYQVRALDLLSFSWNPRTPWKERYSELAQFQKKHGHCMVPSNEERYRVLYVWCCNQKQQYRQYCMKQASGMTPKRHGALVSLGFFDHPEGTWSVLWETRLAELRRYKAEYGNCNVLRYDEDNPKLGRWVDTQRTARRLKQKGKKSPLTDDRERALDELGFEWREVQNDDNVINCVGKASALKRRSRKVPQRVGEAKAHSAITVDDASFIHMTDQERFAAWRERFREFRND